MDLNAEDLFGGKAQGCGGRGSGAQGKEGLGEWGSRANEGVLDGTRLRHDTGRSERADAP